MSLKIIRSIAELQKQISQHKNQLSIGLVPTMGNLHQGHIDLVDCAREKADVVIASIFVNPMQFGAGEDLDNYPRTVDADIKKLTAAGADMLFSPEEAEIYAEDISASTQVIVPKLTSLWCGTSRPGHFDGVTTIVTKLFNLVQPDIAVFGQKDFQQLTIIRKMVSDLNIPVEIISVPTRREADGLAMSSRNGYLSFTERKIAPKLHQQLLLIEKQLKTDMPPVFNDIEEKAKAVLNSTGFKTDYLGICRQSDLMPAEAGDRQLVVLAAAYLGNTRLIDNITIELDD